MAGKKILIEATPDGEVTITAEGVKGTDCKHFTKDFEAALGTSKSSTPTREMYEKPLKAKQKVSQ
jgi:hypothetical protein